MKLLHPGLDLELVIKAEVTISIVCIVSGPCWDHFKWVKSDHTIIKLLKIILITGNYNVKYQVDEHHMALREWEVFDLALRTVWDRNKRPKCQCVIPSLYFQESHSAWEARVMFSPFHSIVEIVDELKPSECKADLDPSIPEGQHNVIPSEKTFNLKLGMSAGP